MTEVRCQRSDDRGHRGQMTEGTEDRRQKQNAGMMSENKFTTEKHGVSLIVSDCIIMIGFYFTKNT